MAVPYLRVAVRVGSIVALDGGARVLAQLAVIVTARLLGPTKFGELTIGLTAFALCCLIADAGLGDSAVQRLTGLADGHQRFRVFGAQRLAIALVVATLGLALMSGLALAGSVSWAAPVLLLGIPGWILLTNAFYAFRIYERLKRAAVVMGLVTLASALGPLGAVLLYGRSALGAAVGAVALLSLLAAVFVHAGTAEPFPSWNGAKSALRLGWPFLATSLAVNLYTRGDRLVIAMVAGSTQTGYYGAAYTLVLSVSMIGTAAQVVAIPVFTRQSRAGIIPWLFVRRWIALAWIPMLVVIGLVAWFAHDIVTFVFEAEYAPAGALLAVLSLTIPFYVLNPVLATVLIVAKQERVVAKIAFANLALAMIMFPIAGILDRVIWFAIASVLIELIGHLLLLTALQRMHQRSIPS